MPEFCPQEGCGFQLVNNPGYLYCPACGWSLCGCLEKKENEYVEQTKQ